MSKKIRPRITQEEYEIIRGIREQCNDHNINIQNVRGGWLKNKQSSLHFKNPAFKDSDEPKIEELDFTSIIPKIQPVSIQEPSRNLPDTTAVFDRLVYTDVHIGMNPNPDGYSLYGGKWDRQELMNRATKMIQHVSKNQFSNEIHVHQLGDLMDGWNKQTERGGHDLPQNMNNQEAYDIAVEFLCIQANLLVSMYNKVHFHMVCVSNHSTAFDYVVCKAFKMIVEQMYGGKVSVHIQRKFIEHYKASDKHTFILTHGKDDKNLKFGFKPVLDKNQENKIDNYLKHHGLIQKGTNIEFAKGDSHQWIFDYSTSESFDYCNYPAFSPSSNWVQTNFQKGISGFIFYNYFEDKKSVHPYLFDWK